MQREVLAKSILTKSGISDYSVNCYVGCLHNCVYCYARYMRKFTNHAEPWGRFLDVKVNAPDLLEREVRRRAAGKVFFSSACDAYQPAERKYELTRRCIRTAAEAGFSISVLTKSSLVVRDLDVISAAADRSVGCTITTLDESLRKRIEVAVSSVEERFRALAAARERGIGAWVFCGPLLPGLTDTPENIGTLFARIAELGVADHVLVDKLNFRSGVYESILDLLRRHYPGLLPLYRRLYSSPDEYKQYAVALCSTANEAARQSGIDCRVLCK